MAERLTITDLEKVKEELKAAGFGNADWRELGGKLGLHDNTLRTISANKRDDADSCFRECLVKWLNRADGVDKAGKPSWTSLANALDKMDDCKNQAEYIRYLSEGKKPAKSTSGSLQNEANKQQNASSSFMCNRWVILPLCVAAVAVSVAIFVIYSPSYLPMKVKGDKQLDISDLSEIISKLNDCQFDAGEWDDLCLDIGLYEVTINIIRSDSNSVRNRLKSCLVKWLNRVDDVEKKGGATWDSLENGLINIGQKPVAEKLRESRKN